MRKILYLANLNPNKFGSIEEQALLLAREIQRNGYKCYLGFIAEPTGALRELYEDCGAEIVSIYCGDTGVVGSRYTISIRKMLALYGFLVRKSIDLVDVNFLGVTNLSVAGMYFTGAKIIITERSSGVVDKRSTLRRSLSSIAHRLLNLRISRYVGISEYAVKRIVKTQHVPKKRVRLIYNGVNLERFIVKDKVSARRGLGFLEDKVIVCAVAMLIPEKGIQCLIEAIGQVKDRDPTGRLQVVIVGDGFYRGELARLAGELGLSKDVLFLGIRDDVPEILAAADIVVVPSLWEEAFGRIVAEAMACGKPVIGSRIGGIPEIIEHDITGLLIEPGNIDELKGGILRMMENPLEREKMGARGRERIANKFNMKRQIEETTMLYRDLLND